jgi:prephenate dehydrogenase
VRREVAIIGLGLIGGSLARALTRAGWKVTGYDRSATLAAARRARALFAKADSVDEAVAAAPLVILAAPPEANRSVLRAVARAAGPRTVITDVGSAKRGIVGDAERLSLNGFVGGHPMAGTTGSGFTGSSAELFRGRPWILTPTRTTAPFALRAVRALALAVGAVPVSMDAAAHDRAMAFLSHVPQLVSWALLEAGREDGVAGKHLAVAGPGFKDMTRLAASPQGVWREILKENRGEVRRALAAFRRALRAVEHAMTPFE